MKVSGLQIVLLLFSTHAAAIGCNAASDAPPDFEKFWSAPTFEHFSELPRQNRNRALAILGSRRVAEVSAQQYELLTNSKPLGSFAYLIRSVQIKDAEGKYVLRKRGAELLVFFGAMGDADECEYSILAVNSNERIGRIYLGAGGAR